MFADSAGLESSRAYVADARGSETDLSPMRWRAGDDDWCGVRRSPSGVLKLGERVPLVSLYIPSVKKGPFSREIVSL